MVKRAFAFSAPVLLAVGFLSWPTAAGRPVAQDDAAGGIIEQETGQGMRMGMPMQDMMKMHEKMMADMKARQAELDALVAKMNSSSGDARATVMAELLTEIVRGHGAMIDHMGSMHQHMMKMGK